MLLLLWHSFNSRALPPTEQVVVRVDTLIYNGIPHDSISSPSTCDSLPIYHFSDSVDGVWSAQVAGHDVELRSLVLRQSYESRYSKNNTPPKWEVTVCGGVSPTSTWGGVGVERNIGRVKLSLGAGYDPFNRTPYVEGGVGLILWREY